MINLLGKEHLDETTSYYLYHQIQQDLNISIEQLTKINLELAEYTYNLNHMLTQIKERQQSFQLITLLNHDESNPINHSDQPLYEYLHQYDYAQAANDKEWDQFLKDIIRENINIEILNGNNQQLSSIFTQKFTPSSSLQSTLVNNSLLNSSTILHNTTTTTTEVDEANLRRYSLTRIKSNTTTTMDSAFLSFLSDFIKDSSLAVLSTSHTLILSLLPQLCGRTINAGIPYDIIRVLLCHPLNQSLLPLHNHNQSATNQISIQLQIKNQNSIIIQAILYNYFHIINHDNLNDTSYYKIVQAITATRMVINYQRIICMKCNTFIAKKGVQVYLNIMDPTTVYDNQQPHIYPYDLYVLLRYIFNTLDQSSSNDVKRKLNFIDFKLCQCDVVCIINTEY